VCAPLNLTKKYEFYIYNRFDFLYFRDYDYEKVTINIPVLREEKYVYISISIPVLREEKYVYISISIPCLREGKYV